MEIKFFTIQKIDNNIRIDKWFYSSFLKLSYKLINQLIRKNQIKINNKKIKNSYKLNIKEILSISAVKISKKNYSKKIINNINIEKLNKLLTTIIYEDEHFFFFNKYQKFCVQNGKFIDISIDTILKTTNINGKIVHRLDKETTGILIVAKNSLIASKISELFSRGNIKKEYLTILIGIPKLSKGFIIKKKNNKYIRSNYKIIKTSKNKFSLVSFYPLTGKKHQIRKHAKSLGCPIYGDVTYKNKFFKNNQWQLHLHAFKIKFNLFNKSYCLKANLPLHFKQILKNF